jgi:hypothetical protein
VRMRRLMLAMSQEKLGAALGLTFQQVQKYERGAPSKKNSTGTCRIWDICCNRLAPMRLAIQRAIFGRRSVLPEFLRSRAASTGCLRECRFLDNQRSVM